MFVSQAAEATPDSATNEVGEEALPKAEVKDEKTPETPVTEPLTNGSSTPEEPKAASPVPEEPAPGPVSASAPTAAAPIPTAAPAVAEPTTPTPAPAEPEPSKPEPKAEPEPEQLPVNGLSLEEIPEAAQTTDSKSEPAADATETVPAPEIPVKKEVCVEQMPVESTPPPLPANPPPSSVASFAATTMAPELTDASLANTAVLVISAQPSIPDTNASNIDVIAPEPHSDLPSDVDRKIENNPSTEALIEHSSLTEVVDVEEQIEVKIESKITTLQQAEEIDRSEVTTVDSALLNSNIEHAVEDENNVIAKEDIQIKGIQDENQQQIKDESNLESPVSIESDKVVETPALLKETMDSLEDLPPPPPLDNEFTEMSSDVPQVLNQIKNANEMKEIIVNSDHISNNVEVNGMSSELLNGNEDVDHQNLKNKSKDLIDNATENVESNGNVEDVTTEATIEKKASNATEEKVITPEESLPPSLSEASEAAGSELSDAFPPPPAELCAPAEPAPPADDTPQVNTTAHSCSCSGLANLWTILASR